MKKIIEIFLFSILISLFSCDSICKQESIKTLFIIPHIYENKTVGYSHYVLIQDFSRKCMDSTTMVNIALKYMDTVTIGRPADVLKFFNSDKDFIPNEISQVQEEINRSCLVTINFDLKTQKPEQFIFYNNDGKYEYWGSLWNPITK
jgi:hypothetical protein